MTDSSQVPPAPPEPASGDRLDSWKEIAAYTRRDVKTVQRWEKREGMPVHRHLHEKMGSVYAFRTELDEWAHTRRLTAPDGSPVAPLPGVATAESSSKLQEQSESAGTDSLRATRPLSHDWRRRWQWALAAVGMIIALALAASLRQAGQDVGNRLADVRFLPLTDFGGIEQAAAISRDGKLVAFLSDRDGQMDVWLTQVGSGEFHNLTRGAARELVNPSVRTLGFSPDGSLVTFWARRLDATHRSEINFWGVPVLGGSPRVYLEGVAEYDWSDDASQLVFHTPDPGDPTFVRGQGEEARRIFSAPAGLHSHFPLWSPDGVFIYLVQGSVPDRMDLWRIRPTGGSPERITNHAATVSHPVFLDTRTLAYLSTDESGSGPWIYSLDVERRVPRRASFGVDRYTSLAASRDRRRLVATLASPKGTLWRVRIGAEPAQPGDARPIRLTTGNGSSPRIGDGFLLYVSSKGTSDSIWTLQGDRSTELWSARETRVTGGPALARDGRRIAFCTRRQDGRTQLWVVNSDGTDAHTLATSLELQGAPTWTPDGQALTVGAVVDGIPSLFSVPVDGGPPVRLVDEHSMDPVWSPNGGIIVFSGADVGTTFSVKAITADGTPRRIPDLTLTRGARHIAFLPDGRSLVVMRGDLRHKNLWAIDVDTGTERQLTDFAPGFELRDFDVAPNGREMVVEQVEEHSDIVLLELPR
ncbi:MAG: DNA-binding protein [Vicinamibacterales bacterium]